MMGEGALPPSPETAQLLELAREAVEASRGQEEDLAAASLLASDTTPSFIGSHSQSHTQSGSGATTEPSGSAEAAAQGAFGLLPHFSDPSAGPPFPL